MTPATRACALSVVAVALLAGAACAVSPSGSVKSPASSPTPSSSPLAPAQGKLAAQVPMPAGFPSDFPTYPGARLTVAGEFTSSGSTSWGMEWQTLDGLAKVQAFFIDKLNSSGWTLLNHSSTPGSFLATFRSTSHSLETGSLGVQVTSGVTKTVLQLTTVP